MDALRLTTVLEEDQPGLGKGAVALRQRGLLDALSHGALNREGNRGRHRRGVRFALFAPAASASAAHAGLRFSRGRLGWRPLRIFYGADHKAVRLGGQGRFLAVDAERKVSGGNLDSRVRGAEPSDF